MLLIFYFTFTLCRTLFVGRFLDDEACNQLIASLIWLQGQNSKDPITLYFNVSSYCYYFCTLLFIFIFVVVVIGMYIHIYISFTILSFLRLSRFPSYSLSLSLYLPPSPLSLSLIPTSYHLSISLLFLGSGSYDEASISSLRCDEENDLPSHHHQYRPYCRYVCTPFQHNTILKFFSTIELRRMNTLSVIFCLFS